MLEQTKSLVHELEALIQYRILKPGREENLQVNRTTFLREQTRLIRLQGELRNARHRIMSLFNYLSIRETSHIRVLLRDLHYSGSQARLEVAEGLSTLHERQSSIENTLQHALETQSGSTPSTAFAIPQSTSVPDNSEEGVEISVIRLGELSCHCSKARVSGYLHTLLGDLFVSYTAAPSSGQYTRQCRCKLERDLVLVYSFPAWFIRQSLSLRVRYSRFVGLTLSLSVIQYLPDDHVIWDLIGEGDSCSLQKLFLSGQISIKAQDASGGGILNVGVVQSLYTFTEVNLVAVDSYGQSSIN